MNKNLLCKVPSALGLIAEVLIIVQLTISLYRTLKPKTKETEPSRDNE